MVKKVGGKKLWQITNNSVFLPIFTAFNRIASDYITHGEIYGLSFMVVYSPLVYQHRACSVIIKCSYLYNELSNLCHDSTFP